MKSRRAPAGVVTALFITLVAACGVDGTGSTSTSPTVTETAPTVLILDGSQSMTKADAAGPRIDAAKKAATTLVDALPSGTEFGLVSYGTGTGATPSQHAAGCRDITVLAPLAPVNVAVARAAIDGITPRGYTPIADSLRRAADMLPASGAAAIVLVSDGEDTCGQPPCDVAQELKKTRPGLEVSTIGFRTDAAASQALRCVAEATGGLFVTAENTAQLSARLLATRNEASRSAIVDGSYLGIALAAPLDEVRAEHPDFPTEGHADGKRTVYVWRDCDWVVGEDQTIDEIRPHAGAVKTVDGIGVGSTVGQAREFYGAPTSDVTNAGGVRTVVFAASGDGDAGYRLTVRGDGDGGVIETVVLCRCAVRAVDPCAGSTGICRHVADADVDGDGQRDPVAVAVDTAETSDDPDGYVLGAGTISVRVGIDGEVRSTSYEVSGMFSTDPAAIYRGAFALTRAKGADIVLYLVHSQGAPDLFGVASWTDSRLYAVHPPRSAAWDRFPTQWPVGNAERRRTLVRCTGGQSMTMTVLRVTPGPTSSTERETTTYRYGDGQWNSTDVETGAGPDLYSGDQADFDPATDTFQCSDLGVRR